jgi:hypothetical protein
MSKDFGACWTTNIRVPAGAKFASGAQLAFYLIGTFVGTVLSLCMNLTTAEVKTAWSYTVM